MECKFLCIVFLSVVALVKCEHLMLGDEYNRPLMHQEKAQYYAIPFTKRVKNYFYSSPEQKVIKSIIAYDNLHTSGTASVTAGGLGEKYVNIRLKSERGKGLDYDIKLYY